MTRVKRGSTANARRKRLLKQAKGFKWGRKTKFRAAKEALLHAWTFQFADRKKKKRTMRRLWTVRVGAAARDNGVSYSKLIAQLKAAHIEIDRKVLSVIAAKHPDIFAQIVATK
ncbi:MAG: 50S ribosomal protein L20 [Candidatus Yanofskybacteria bacterium]|nr:50S ribosomal protein L20 [Candidatus Yanofskybacteria bacterium]